MQLPLGCDINSIYSLPGNHKPMNREKFLKVLLISLTVIIIAIWVTVIIIQNQNAKIQLQEEKLHNLLYLDVLKKAFINNIFAVEKIESLLIEKITTVNNLLTNSLFPSDKELERICRENSFYEISFVDSSSNIIRSNFRKGEFPYDLSLLELAPGEEITFRIPAEEATDSENLYYIKRHGNYFFVGAIAQADIRNHIGEISLSRMMEFVESSLDEKDKIYDLTRHVKYIVIQDTLGIIAATRNISSLTRMESDPFLVNSYLKEDNDSRITSFQAETILETVSPFYIDNFDFGIIRLGSSLARIEKARERRLFVIVIFSFILLASLFLEAVFYKNYLRLRESTEELNASRRMVELARLGGEVAHEIKNPLNSIFMVLQRIKKEFRVQDNTEEYTNLLAISFSEIERLTQIIERFLSFTRDMIINKTSTHITKLLQNTCSLFSDQAARENVLLQSECETDLVIDIDERKILQVLINLIKNSFEAFEPLSQEKRIMISARSDKQDLVIEVEDNGRGIEPQVLPLIWDLYYSTKESGNGIGLPTTRKIIEAHHGNIAVVSKYGKGTIFTIRLPLGNKN
ncbi:MAG: GHKL domain-containing protein [Candidatus Cloacimonetes bacterium]|nr:GHKL domain-containing protein [Candidatus Cloacimonadota bacterium]